MMWKKKEPKPDIITACRDFKWRVLTWDTKNYVRSLMPENDEGFKRAEDALAAYKKWKKFLAQEDIIL